MQKAPRVEGRVLCVIELERDKAAPPLWIRTTVSLPGRDGTMTKVWDLPAGHMRHGDWEDCMAWVLKTLDGAVACAIGVQGVLGQP